MVEPLSLILADAEATRRAGASLAAAIRESQPARLIVYLEGDLGAGKTTLARGFLEDMGHAGRVPSPTYTLVEPYALAGYDIYHIDLYRVRDPRELDDLGLADQLSEGSLLLVEWPEHGRDRLPAADVRLRLQYLATGRGLICQAGSDAGHRVLDRLPAAISPPTPAT